MRASRAVVAIFALQLFLLTIGIDLDYRLKHEDNNALHATFARSHLTLGLGVTTGQNYFYSPATGGGAFYAHHPPGPGLVLAAVYFVTGSDGPSVTRATAALFHIAATWLFYGLARRIFRTRHEVLIALFLFVVLPESAFFGRMMNHEVMVLPAAILLVRGYWEAIHRGAQLEGTWSTPQWMAAMAGGAAFAAFSGWAGFFSIGACALHAALQLLVIRNGRARLPLMILIGIGVALGAGLVMHLAWLLGGDVTYLRDLMGSRMGTGGEVGIPRRIARILELHWRYFGLTSLVGLFALGYRYTKQIRSSAVDPAIECGVLFLTAGVGYVAVFSLNAGAHDYWQFLLLPASAVGLTLAFRYLCEQRAMPSRYQMARVLTMIAILDITVATAVTLVQRHTRTEGLCVRVVAQLRRDHL